MSLQQEVEEWADSMLDPLLLATATSHTYREVLVGTYLAGYKAAAESRDQRIKELERAAMDVILSDEYGDHHVPNHDALAALFPNIKRGYWP